MADRVAGHVFEGVGSDQRCVCGRWWTEIADCDDTDLGKTDRAHAGQLNAAELSEIRQKKQHEMRFWDAVAEASAG